MSAEISASRRMLRSVPISTSLLGELERSHVFCPIRAHGERCPFVSFQQISLFQNTHNSHIEYAGSYHSYELNRKTGVKTGSRSTGTGSPSSSRIQRGPQWLREYWLSLFTVSPMSDNLAEKGKGMITFFVWFNDNSKLICRSYYFCSSYFLVP